MVFQTRIGILHAHVASCRAPLIVEGAGHDATVEDERVAVLSKVVDI
jgi:hypothetical protein